MYCNEADSWRFAFATAELCEKCGLTKGLDMRRCDFKQLARARVGEAV